MLYTRSNHIVTNALATALLSTTAFAQIEYTGMEFTNPSPAFLITDFYGNDIELENGLLAVASSNDDTVAQASGAVYIYDAETGAYLRSLSGSNVSGNDTFGRSIDMHDNLMVVGASQDTFGATFRAGSAYFINPSTGAQLGYIGASDAASFDVFGASVALNSVITLVGAPNTFNTDSSRGAVYAFLNSTRKEILKFTAAPIRGDIRFGWSLAINDQVFVVGAPGNSDPETSFPGEAYVFDINTGIPFQLLTADTPDPASQFGWEVAIDGNTVVIGAPTDDAAGTGAGAVYVFNALTGDQLTRITSPNPAPEEQFGYSVDIKDNIIAIGANQSNSTALGSGAVYVYDTTTFELIAEVSPDSLAEGSAFGSSVAIDGESLAVGAQTRITISPTNRGSAYLLHQRCLADLNEDGSADFLDISQFINTRYDWNDDGFFDFLDISGFVQSYTTGCPEL